ncbi:glycosyltransferase family 2 protein [soil metagenome]
MLETITPLILTYNEAPNIDRTVQSLTWATQILVVDSYSTDDTLERLKQYAQVKIIQREFDTFASQCNFGLSQITTEWVLSLDADYVCTKELIDEIKSLPYDLLYDGYFARFKYCVFGKPLRATLYPARQILYRKAKAHYLDDGHGHRVQIDGKSGLLTGYIHHDDRKSLGRWLQSQDRYMIIESQKLLSIPAAELNTGDRIRKKKLLAPLIVLFYCLILKRGILDGWPGWYYALQRMTAEIILAIRLIEFEHLQEQIETSTPSSPKLTSQVSQT